MYLYKASLIMPNARLYTSSIAKHFCRSAASVSSSWRSSLNKLSLYNSVTNRFCTASRELLTNKCMIALGTLSRMVFLVILKYEVINEPVIESVSARESTHGDHSPSLLTNKLSFNVLSVLCAVRSNPVVSSIHAHFFQLLLKFSFNNVVH